MYGAVFGKRFRESGIPVDLGTLTRLTIFRIHRVSGGVVAANGILTSLGGNEAGSPCVSRRTIGTIDKCLER